MYIYKYSCWENPMDRGTWSATVHRVSKIQTQLSEHTQCVLNSIKYCSYSV